MYIRPQTMLLNHFKQILVDPDRYKLSVCMVLGPLQAQRLSLPYQGVCTIEMSVVPVCVC